MSGEKDLTELLRSLTAQLHPDIFVFATHPRASMPAGVNPILQFEEPEGTTFILLRKEAETAKIDYDFPCRMITLDVHSALDAVGFIAHIATKLAAAGMGVNPVAGFYHDHLFVPEGRECEALEILKQIAQDARV